MAFLTTLIILLSLLFSVDASLSGTDHCHFRNDTVADCDTFSSVIKPDLSEETRFLTIRYFGNNTALDSRHLSRYKKLESITLSGNVRYIKPLSFKAQDKLKSLEIIGTKMTEIDKRLFQANMTFLHKLNLQQNQLKIIPVEWFQFLGELKTLNLAENCIQIKNCAYLGEVFKDLSKLSSLNIAGLRVIGNYKSNWSNLLLSVNKKLLHLNISATNVTDLYSDNVSDHLSNLKELDVSSPLIHPNQCATHAWILFEKLPTTLSKIYLRQWRSIEKPQPSCFLNETTLDGLRRLPKLELIDMHSSDSIFGSTLYYGTFENFTRLQTLDLGWCRIWDVENLAFDHCPQLSKLVLDGNPIGSKAMRLQNDWKEIKSLGFSHISALSDPSQTHLPALSLELPPRLESIDLSNNFLHAFPIFSIKINGVTQIKETSCQKHSDKTATLYTPSLESINLDNNLLTNFLPKHLENRPKLCTKMINLTTVSIQHNRLERLKGICDSIKRLRLRWNFIGKHWIANTKALKNLHLLEYLDLSHNTIYFLNEKLLSEMKDIVEFRFAGNNITYLPEGVFANNFKIKLIDLSFNQITSVEDRLISAQVLLQTLNMRSNSIASFAKEFIDVLTVSSVKIFEVAGNELECGCARDHWYFRDWLNNDNKSVFVPEFRQLKCRLQEKKVFYTYARDVFYCDWLVPIIATASTIVCIIVTVLIVLPCYKYRWYIRHTRVVWRAFISQLKSVRFDQNCEYDAFVSYNTSSNSDTEFVVNCLLPSLENKEKKVSISI